MQIEYILNKWNIITRTKDGLRVLISAALFIALKLQRPWPPSSTGQQIEPSEGTAIFLFVHNPVHMKFFAACSRLLTKVESQLYTVKEYKSFTPNNRSKQLKPAC